MEEAAHALRSALPSVRGMRAGGTPALGMVRQTPSDAPTQAASLEDISVSLASLDASKNSKTLPLGMKVDAPSMAPTNATLPLARPLGVVLPPVSASTRSGAAQVALAPALPNPSSGVFPSKAPEAPPVEIVDPSGARSKKRGGTRWWIVLLVLVVVFAMLAGGVIAWMR
jgi:hypothetical protein